jgi:hypothetical protein
MKIAGFKPPKPMHVASTTVGRELKSALPRKPGSPDTRYVAGYNPRKSHYTESTGTNPHRVLPKGTSLGAVAGVGGGRAGHSAPPVQMKHEAAPLVPFGNTMMTGET